METFVHYRILKIGCHVSLLLHLLQRKAFQGDVSQCTLLIPHRRKCIRHIRPLYPLIVWLHNRPLQHLLPLGILYWRKTHLLSGRQEPEIHSWFILKDGGLFPPRRWPGVGRLVTEREKRTFIFIFYYRNYMDSTIRQVQLKCLEILDIVDKICRDHQIQYSLCGGTVVGAHLYKKFLPWDDAIDLMMTRENYNRFIELAPKVLPEGFSVLNYQQGNYYRWRQYFDRWWRSRKQRRCCCGL